MTSYHPYTLFPLGDAALLISFGEEMDETIHQKLLLLYEQLKALKHAAITDLVPAYNSLAVHYDVVKLLQRNPHQTAFESMANAIQKLQPAEEILHRERPLIKVPVCYAPSFSPDMEGLMHFSGLSAEAIITLHSSVVYRVYLIGFLPGFAYMGTVDEKIAMPRHAQPRLHVPAGAVGIAGSQTGIYPMNSPGGWQLIGQTPLTLFDKDASAPVLFQPGDAVQFFSITEYEFANY